MQIVLSGNRVIAHGESCFLAIGGTVVCEETGKAYSNATVAEVDVLPADIDRVGYEYHAGVFVPCAPYGMTEDGYLMGACFECGTPRYTDISIAEVRDRLNTYATILATYPGGSECTCEKDGVILTASDTSGSYSFNVPGAGTWAIKIKNGADTAERAVEITKRWQYETVKMSYFSATITVTYSANSTCTCSDGVSTFTDTNDTDADKTVVFTAPNAGTWTVTATDGTQAESEAVKITADGQSERVDLCYFTGVIYDSGNEYTRFTGGWNAIGQATKEADYLYPYAYKGVGCVFTENMIDVSDFSTLTFALAGLSVRMMFCVSKTRPTESNINSSGLRDSAAAYTDPTSGATASIDVSKLSGEYYIFAYNYGGSTNTSTYFAKITKVSLE